MTSRSASSMTMPDGLGAAPHGWPDVATLTRLANQIFTGQLGGVPNPTRAVEGSPQAIPESAAAEEHAGCCAVNAVLLHRRGTVAGVTACPGTAAGALHAGTRPGVLLRRSGPVRRAARSRYVADRCCAVRRARRAARLPD